MRSSYCSHIQLNDITANFPRCITIACIKIMLRPVEFLMQQFDNNYQNNVDDGFVTTSRTPCTECTEWMVDPGEWIGKKSPKRETAPKLFLRGIWFLWDSVHALRLYLCTYMLSFSSGEEATGEECVVFFWCVRITIIGLCRLCLDQNLSRTQTQRDWPFNHFQTRRHWVLASWVLGTNSRTWRRAIEVMSLS